MAKRIPWSEQEALLLFDTYDKIQKAPTYKPALTAALSVNLRRMAKDNRLTIDSSFRNLNGIGMRLLEIEKILNPEAIGLTNTSELFRTTAKLYSNHRRTFLSKLHDVSEYRVQIINDLISFDQLEAIVLLDAYLGLDVPGETKAHASRLVSAKLRSLATSRGRVFNEGYRSPGGISGRFRKMALAFAGEYLPNDPIPQVFTDVVVLYKNDRNRFKALLKSANDLIGDVQLAEDVKKAKLLQQKASDALPVFRTKYVANKTDRQLKDQYPTAFVSVYNALERRIFTSPKGVTATDIYADLKKKHQRKVISEILLKASWAKEIRPGKYVHTLGGALMAKQEKNEHKFFDWLRKQVSLTEYNSYQSSAQSVSMLLMHRRIIKQPLFLIDDQSELAVIQEKIRKTNFNVKLKTSAIQLVSIYMAYLDKISKHSSGDNEPENAQKVQNAFYDWLSQSELLSGPTCRSYLSGLRSAELYAKEHGYANTVLFTENAPVARDTALALLQDSNFTMQHPTYRPHLRRYLQYLGVTNIPETNSQEGTKPVKEVQADPALVTAISEVVKSHPDGILQTELADRFSKYSDVQFKTAVVAAGVIPVLNKYHHKDNIEDFDYLVDTLYAVLSRQFKADGGYTSDCALFKEVHPKLDDFFFYNNAFESRQEIYDIAAFLFGTAGYKNASYLFVDKRHIWKERPDYSTDFGGLLVKFGREHGNVFSRDQAINYVGQHGSGTPAQTISLILNRSGRKLFLQYAENQFVLAEALNINDVFLQILNQQIECLLEGEDYVALGDISDYFYSTLPELPVGVSWGPLLLESILDRYDLRFITISAGNSNDMKTVDAALLRKGSQFITFADIVWNELNKDYALPKELSSDEFREYLLKKGFLHGYERLYTVHKTVEKDLRFYWTNNYSTVTISK